jgi:hypothetical protein
MIAWLFALIVLGAVLYLVENFIPMSPPFKIVVRVVVVLILIWMLLQLIGLAPGRLELR